MNFIIDAQLPPSLKFIFNDRNIRCIHTLDLVDQNNTTDTEIRDYCEVNDSILITKDEDFYYTHILNNRPRKLILIKIGNCSKSEIISIIKANLDVIIEKIQVENLIFIS